MFAKTCRVLRPGGMLTGCDSLPNARLVFIHLFDTMVPVDPGTLPGPREIIGVVLHRVLLPARVSIPAAPVREQS
ncbi:MAG TPA: hypothetical protein VLW50_21575 [Streptosporangiaceae bacterium]|nr:hypothetical protein [Streptosporangiaceae bacterium]